MNKVRSVVRIVGIALLAAAALILMIAAKSEKKKMNVSDFTINIENDGNEFIRSHHIYESIAHLVDTSRTMQLSELDLKEIADIVQENEYVEACKIYVNNRRKLHIDITQKQPQLRVINNSGVSYYLDNHGVKFPLTDIFTANVPVITGFVKYSTDSLGQMDSPVIKDVMVLHNYLQENELAPLFGHINVEKDGDIVLIPRMGQHTVMLGDVENLDNKFFRLLTFYKEGLSREGWDKYDEINLKFNDQVVAKKK